MEYIEAEIKENYIYRSLLQIKKNPDFALGGKSIRALDGFFTGIGFALPQSKRQYFSWYKEFQEIKFLIPELLEWLQDCN